MSCPIRSLLTKVRPMLSQYEQNAMRTRSVLGVILGSLIALMGTIAKALRSLDLSCLGLNTGSPVDGPHGPLVHALALSMLRLATSLDLHDTSASRSS